MAIAIDNQIQKILNRLRSSQLVHFFRWWQSELLEYSWKRAGQPGELVRLVATEGDKEPPKHRYARTVATQSWETHPNSGDWYPVYNKPASLFEWLHRERPSGTILLVALGVGYFSISRRRPKH